MDSAFIVLGVGADPRIFHGVGGRLQQASESNAGLVLTCREQSSDEFGALASILDLLNALDCLSFPFQ
jgi:hypothetical protein